MPCEYVRVGMILDIMGAMSGLNLRPALHAPPAVRPGDRVAILSPSRAAPGVFPEVHEIGMRVLREQLGLVPVEFPTTRQTDASRVARANDIMAAFSDPSISAVMASIGGDGQITVLPHLDPELLAANPTRFFGYSDNTNLLNYLWNLGIISYHGGSTMVHLARAGGVHSVSLESLKKALFTSDTVEISPVEEFTDLAPDWNDLSTLEESPPATVDPGWYWHNAGKVVSGPSWGGNLEILHWNLAAGRWIGPVNTYAGCVLLLETSEVMPSAQEVFWMLRNAGERGLLEQFEAIVVAKPKAWNHDHRTGESERARFREDQRASILRALADYNPGAMVVFGPDFGHTDPQYVLPYGGQVTVNGPGRQLLVSY